MRSGVIKISVDIGRLLPGAQQQRRAAGESRQCHVVSVRRKLNTDLFITGRGR